MSKYVIPILLIIWLWESQNAVAQTFSSVKDIATVKKKMTETTRMTTSIQCNFTQEKHLSMLAEKVVSTGVFYLRADHRVRLEYLKPFKYLMWITGDKITIQDNSRTTEMDMHRSKLFTQVNHIITGTMQGGMLDNPDFDCVLSESTTQYKIELMPKTKGLKQFLKSIIIFIDKRDMSADRLEMHEPGGDYTLITFTDKVLNGKIPDSRFVVTH